MTNTTVANTREEVTAVMDVKMQELETAYKGTTEALQEVEDVKQEGTTAIDAMQEQINALKESIKMATDLGEARLLAQQVEGLEKDVKLQGMLVNGAVAKKKEELEQAFETFYKAYGQATKAFKALDTEYGETMCMRTYKDDEKKVKGYSWEMYKLLSFVRSAIQEAGLVAKGETKFKGFTISQSQLDTSYASVGSALRRSESYNSVYDKYLPENR